jgi:hypothetical protein
MAYTAGEPRLVSFLALGDADLAVNLLRGIL